MRVEDALPQVARSSIVPTRRLRASLSSGSRSECNWVLITDNPDRDGERPTLSRAVPAPPAGTKILAILNEQGGNEANENTRDLMIEIALEGSEILESHR